MRRSSPASRSGLGDEDDRTSALALARQAAQASRAKDECPSVLSDELHTPLHAIQGWAQLMATQREADPSITTRPRS